MKSNANSIEIMSKHLSENRCRVCGQAFFNDPLLRYVNMPAGAQSLPDCESLATDTGVDLEVCQCSGCGLVQLNNAPVPYYKDVIRSAAFSAEMKEFRHEQFGTFVEKYSLKGKKVLEIGCGKGEYLSLMQQWCVDAYGIEHLIESVEKCRRDGLNVSQGFIETSDRLPDAPFDGFFILNFLEHIPDLNSTLRGIYSNITDDAVGLIEVPNFNMILQHKLFSEFISDHIYYFTKETLSSALTLNGFEIIDCREVWHNYIISVVVRKKKKLDISNFIDYQSRIKEELEKYIAGFGEKKIAIWGAGHQALAIIALSNLGDKIRYVIDSAPFKQGKFTPASHVPIVSPSILKSDPVKAVIVMAASYSDEVVRYLQEHYSVSLPISVLRPDGLRVVQ